MPFVAPGLQGMLQPLEPWLKHPAVQELILNRPQQLFVEAGNTMACYDVAELTDGYVRRLFQLLAASTFQVIDDEHPLMCASLPGRMRMQCVLPPVSAAPSFCIRKFSAQAHDLHQFCDSGCNTVARQFVDQLAESKIAEVRRAISQRRNVLVSGATSSGKTSFINACLHHVPHTERLVLIEDVAELQCQHPNQLRLLCPASSAVAAVTAQDLLQACLRMRPDRIVVGEVRGAEAIDLVMANNTGHKGSLCSIHANSATEALLRLRQLIAYYQSGSHSVAAIDDEIGQAIDCVIHLERTQRGRTVAEVMHIYH